MSTSFIQSIWFFFCLFFYFERRCHDPLPQPLTPSPCHFSQVMFLPLSPINLSASPILTCVSTDHQPCSPLSSPCTSIDTQPDSELGPVSAVPGNVPLVPEPSPELAVSAGILPVHETVPELADVKPALCLGSFLTLLTVTGGSGI